MCSRRGDVWKQNVRRACLRGGRVRRQLQPKKNSRLSSKLESQMLFEQDPPLVIWSVTRETDHGERMMRRDRIKNVRMREEAKERAPIRRVDEGDREGDQREDTRTPTDTRAWESSTSTTSPKQRGHGHRATRHQPRAHTASPEIPRDFQAMERGRSNLGFEGSAPSVQEKQETHHDRCWWRVAYAVLLRLDHARHHVRQHERCMMYT